MPSNTTQTDCADSGSTSRLWWAVRVCFEARLRKVYPSISPICLCGCYYLATKGLSQNQAGKNKPAVVAAAPVYIQSYSRLLKLCSGLAGDMCKLARTIFYCADELESEFCCHAPPSDLNSTELSVGCTV